MPVHDRRLARPVLRADEAGDVVLERHGVVLRISRNGVRECVRAALRDERDGRGSGDKARRQAEQEVAHGRSYSARNASAGSIRVALGASGTRVMRLVTLRAFILIGIGLVLGLGGATGLTRFLASELFEVSPTDPATFTVVTIGLTIVALVACLIPTRRAVRVDPAVALRYE
jgi:hypothetical protein